MKVSCILACAGKGSRCGLGYNKLLHEVAGKPIFQYTLEKFVELSSIKEIIISASEEDSEKIRAITDEMMVNLPIKVIKGGETRSLSIKNCLQVVSDKADIVIIHDGARPYVDVSDIENVISLANDYGAAVLTHPVTDTLKTVGDDGGMYGAKRDNYFTVSTPQAFNAAEIMRAYEEVDYDSNFTDDTEVYAQYIGKDIMQSPASNSNKKITTLEDIREFERFIVGDDKPTVITPKPIKTVVGIGYDVHRLVENRRLVIGGLVIPYEKGLLGHSDADVLLHAIMDSMLSAVGDRDIGYHFPDDDPRYKDRASTFLLEKVLKIVKNKGFKVQNIAATILCEKPKLSSYIPQMIENISSTAKIDKESVGIMATTTEGLGVIGNGQGIACYAVCTLVSE